MSEVTAPGSRARAEVLRLLGMFYERSKCPGSPSDELDRSWYLRSTRGLSRTWYWLEVRL